MKHVWGEILYNYYCHEAWMISKINAKPKIAAFYLVTIAIWFILPLSIAAWLLEFLAQYITFINELLIGFRSIKPSIIHVPMHATLLIVLARWFPIVIPNALGDKTPALKRINKISAKLSNLDKSLEGTNND